MAEEHSLNLPTEPRFDSYLLAQDTEHDCYFMVGKRELVETKKRGVAKKIQMAHSSVLRSQLDLEYPDTFIILLNLSFDKAAENKYMMEPLKARLSSRLMTLLSPDNIFQLLNNPACYRLLELQCAITEILQCEAARDLDSRAFLNLNVDDFTKILEQEAMDEEKIQVWRAAVKWARGGTEEGEFLWKQLSEHLKQIQDCTISIKCKQFLQEVVPTNFPNNLSLRMVCLYHKKNENQAKLVTVSSKTTQIVMDTSINILKTPTKTLEAFYIGLPLPISGEYKQRLNSYVLILTNSEFGAELLPLEFTANEQPKIVPEGLTYECDCTVEITEITDYVNNTSTKPPVTVRFCQQVEYGSLFQVPLTSNGENIRLCPNTKYMLSVKFIEKHPMLYYGKYSQDNAPPVSNEHMALELEVSGTCHYWSPVKGLRYKPITRCDV